MLPSLLPGIDLAGVGAQLGGPAGVEWAGTSGQGSCGGGRDGGASRCWAAWGASLGCWGWLLNAWGTYSGVQQLPWHPGEVPRAAQRLEALVSLLLRLF